ncbi:serine/threonine protein kinase [Brevibacterium aurantiacum]|uniref:Serine/threonine protein kinase n=2 Tax=Brevibacterium aurantiacum TaxID=273384 RepID=A0A3T0DJK6_BREAU|nr:serine/threonine protein kinase [Brevibacterium aurantiacum]
MLQATFVPAEHGFAWWGPQDTAARVADLGLPRGRSARLRLAQPAGSGIAVDDVDVHITDLLTTVDALQSLLGSGALAPSVRSWRELSAHPDAQTTLPLAAHAVVNEAETAMMTADAATRRFRQALSTGATLQGRGFTARLRPYQAHGIAWLREHAEAESGALLADEMGLGKTVQAIGLLAARRSQLPHLVVCPTSLVGNWRREIERFAPHLPVRTYHGPTRRLPADLLPGEVVLTSYTLLRSDEDLSARAWDIVVFDEAQNLKNPGTKVTRTAKRLQAHSRIMLTGTPVENSLEELWSILSIADPTILGPRQRFRQRFVGPIQNGRSTRAAKALTELIAPHLLRRTKSAVVDELPPKVNTTLTCTLTPEQIRLYSAAVNDAFHHGFGSGFERNGRVLTLLTALKQICNHPAQYEARGGTQAKGRTAVPAAARDATGDEINELTRDSYFGRSGKFDRACEVLSEIVANGERAIVFTQYRAMGDLLSAGIADSLGSGPIPFLHGGLPIARRDKLVHSFQTDDEAPPILILSLRAAGTGLNLTRASHVLHFDRWWNPAVEEQATARAHRIGQRRVLNVHTLIAAGTIEDHIDALHREKQGLAELVTGDSEQALATLPDEQLWNLFALDGQDLR